MLASVPLGGGVGRDTDVGTVTRTLRLLVPIAAMLVLAAGPLQAQDLTYRGSLGYSTGSYVFAERTHSAYLFTGLGLGAGPFRLDASIPLVLQNSTLVTWVAGEPLPTGGPDHEAVGRREPGTTLHGRRGSRMDAGTDSVSFRNAYEVELGDPTVYGSVELHSGTGRIRSVLVTAGAKAPLANLDSGVGTGAWDFSMGTSLTASVARFFLFGDLSYWWLGDLPELELRDGLAYGIGVGHAILDGRASLLATVTGTESAVSTLDAPLSVSLSVGATLEGGRQINAGLSAGLTESSPDLGAFVGWSLPL